MLEGISDGDLMARIASGDQGAFRVLVVRHLAGAHTVARHFLPLSQDAEEAMQDAWNKVWQHAIRFDCRKAAFKTWFYRILVNTCTDKLRRSSGFSKDLEWLTEELADDGMAQDEVLAAGEENRRIRNAVQSLPEKQRMAIVLCYFEELTNREAAEVMGVHIKALEGLLVRARKALHGNLEQKI